jgi:hypothetical protein
MKDCIIKKVIEKRVTGCQDTILREEPIWEICLKIADIKAVYG